MVQWAMDFSKIGQEPNIDGLNQVSFLEAIKTANRREQIRLQEADSIQARAKEASPGKLKGDKDHIEWEAKFENQLSILQGVVGVPLLCVIREAEEPEDDEEFATFQEECIAKAPLKGPVFEADARQVHQLIASCATGESLSLIHI